MDERRFSYFFLGLGIGVAAGILFAPKSGDETRALLRSRAEDSGDYLKRRTEELKDAATDAVERGRSAVARQRDQWSAAVDAGKSAYRETVATRPESGSLPEGI
ncbi:MAG: YtxH domain-containing protein [Bryobacteraceae bacterium]